MSIHGLVDTPEFRAVRAIVGGDTAPARVVGPGDDAAILPDGTVLSTDVAVEGVHFRLDWIDADAAGGRAARAALSDLAAMGAEPTGLLLSLSGPDRDLLVAAGCGAREAGRTLGAPLLGGDLAAAAGPLTVGVTVVGRLSGAAPWLRSGARPGHALFVTGRLGGAAAAVSTWDAGGTPEAAALEAFVRPPTRLAMVAALRDLLAPAAAIDLSDGLAADARNLARASEVGLRLAADAIPVAGAAVHGRSTAEALRLALGGGEDYELLLAAEGRPGVEAAILEATGVPLARVGSVVAGEGVSLAERDGAVRPLEGGFAHWSDR